MSHQILMEDIEIVVDIQFANGGMAYDHTHIQMLESLVRQWFRDFPIKEFKFFVSATPGIYKYKFEHQDGRKWTQNIDFNQAPTTDPLMDFGGDFWRLSEFAVHRDIRLEVVLLHTQFYVEKISVERATP